MKVNVWLPRPASVRVLAEPDQPPLVERDTLPYTDVVVVEMVLVMLGSTVRLRHNLGISRFSEDDVRPLSITMSSCGSGGFWLAVPPLVSDHLLDALALPAVPDQYNVRPASNVMPELPRALPIRVPVSGAAAPVAVMSRKSTLLIVPTAATEMDAAVPRVLDCTSSDSPLTLLPVNVNVVIASDPLRVSDSTSVFAAVPVRVNASPETPPAPTLIVCVPAAVRMSVMPFQLVAVPETRVKVVLVTADWKVPVLAVTVRLPELALEKGVPMPVSVMTDDPIVSVLIPALTWNLPQLWLIPLVSRAPLVSEIVLLLVVASSNCHFPPTPLKVMAARPLPAVVIVVCVELVDTNEIELPVTYVMPVENLSATLLATTVLVPTESVKAPCVRVPV